MEYNEEEEWKIKRDERIANTDLSGALLLLADSDGTIVNLDGCNDKWLETIMNHCDDLRHKLAIKNQREADAVAKETAKATKVPRSIQTAHGLFRYEAADDYTVSESPDLKSYEVVFKDEVIGLIDLNYETSKGCSNRYGWTDVRGDREGWTFNQFDAEIFPQMRTVRNRFNNLTNEVHPSFAVTAEFLPDRFHSIKQAFKFCVKKICEHLDSLEVVE